MKNWMIGLALLASSTVALAQTEEGGGEKPPLSKMTRVSDGLYVQKEENRESYIATNAAGRLAIAEKMRQNNEKFAKLYAQNGISDAEQLLLSRSQDAQALLRKSAVRTQTKAYEPGTCGNGSSLLATAYTSDGVAAIATAANVLDFGPATPTTNWAMARVGHAYNEDIQTGLTQAVASAENYSACMAEAWAIVTCPAGYGPGTNVAYDYSYGPGIFNCQIE